MPRVLYSHGRRAEARSGVCDACGKDSEKDAFKMNFLRFVARQKLRFHRGDSWASSLRSLLIVGVFVRSFALPDYWIAILGVAYALLAWFIGRVDEKVGVWRAENDRASELNPALVRIERGVRRK